MQGIAADRKMMSMLIAINSPFYRFDRDAFFFF